MKNVLLELLTLVFAVSTQMNYSFAGAQGAPKPAVTIHMTESLFKPMEATVHVGDTVVFVNDYEVAHTVTADDKSFDSKSVAAHQTWKRTFSKAGSYAYVCLYHPGMRGSLLVTDLSSK